MEIEKSPVPTRPVANLSISSSFALSAITKVSAAILLCSVGSRRTSVWVKLSG